MRIRNTLALIGATAATTLGSAAHAGMIYWNMGTAGATSNAFEYTAGSITIGNLTQGNSNGATTMLGASSVSSGYTFTLNGSSTNASGGNNAGVAAKTGVLSTAANGSAYFEFTITPAANVYSAFINQIGFGSRSTTTGPQSIALRSSADNYASDIATTTVSANSTWAYKTMNFSNVNLAAGVTTTFRLYGYGGTGSATAGTINWRMDDLTVVPAPGAAALIGLAGLITPRRRK